MPRSIARVVNVAVGGPQGVGKTSTLRALARLRPEFQVIYFGEQLPDDFLDHGLAEKERIRATVTRRIASTLARRDSTTVVDLHYLDLRERNPRLQPLAFLSRFDLLVFLRVAPAVLRQRRAAETDRNDRQLGPAEARNDIAAHVEYFDQLVRAGIPAVLIDCQGQPLDVVRQLLGHIETGT